MTRQNAKGERAESNSAGVFLHNADAGSREWFRYHFLPTHVCTFVFTCRVFLPVSGFGRPIIVPLLHSRIITFYLRLCFPTFRQACSALIPFQTVQEIMLQYLSCKSKSIGILTNSYRILRTLYDLRK